MVEAQVLASWLTPTPTFLFVLLNILLAFIFLSHNSKNSNKNKNNNAALSSTASPPQSHPQQLIRTPSLFSRVASFNFSHYYHHHDSHVAPQLDAAAEVVNPPVAETVARAPSLLYRVASQEGNNEVARDVVSEGHVRIENEEKMEVKKVKKVVRKKQLQKEGVSGKTTAFKRGDEEGVDSKADDFINKFKQQLKLQRLESLFPYRDNASTLA